MTGSRLIALWGPPRSRSTVILRMMLQRGDLTVVHEPFSNLAVLGYFRVGDEQADSYDDLVTLLCRESRRIPVFFKDTTEYRYPEVLEDQRILTGATNTFIIREPAEAIASHYAINHDLTVAEVGYEHLFETFTAARDATGTTPTVIDAADLVADPSGIVSAYCARIGLSFWPRMLSWEPGERTEWSRTARWHRDVSESCQVTPTASQYAVRVDNDERLAAMYRHHLPFYEELRRHRIRPSAPASSAPPSDSSAPPSDLPDNCLPTP
jgi:hypothetical protein